MLIFCLTITSGLFEQNCDKFFAQYRWSLKQGVAEENQSVRLHYKNTYIWTRVYSTGYCRHASNLTRVLRDCTSATNGHLYFIHVSIWTRVFNTCVQMDTGKNTRVKMDTRDNTRVQFWHVYSYTCQTVIFSKNNFLKQKKKKKIAICYT